MPLYSITYNPMVFDTVTDKPSPQEDVVQSMVVQAPDLGSALSRFHETTAGRVITSATLKTKAQAQRDYRKAILALNRAQEKAHRLRREADTLVKEAQEVARKAYKKLSTAPEVQEVWGANISYTP